MEGNKKVRRLKYFRYVWRSAHIPQPDLGLGDDVLLKSQPQ